MSFDDLTAACFARLRDEYRASAAYWSDTDREHAPDWGDAEYEAEQLLLNPDWVTPDFGLFPA